MIIPITRKRARIEIIPLIDIIFFLLATFVMLSLSMVKNQGISVNLPKAATSAKQNMDKIVTITISGQQQIYIDKQPVSFGQMCAQLKQLKISSPDLKVLINGDQKASFGRAIEILDEVRLLGIDKVSIRTKSVAVSGSET